MRDVLELFAGPGGYSEGLRSIGVESVGVEVNAAACLSAEANGHHRVHADVTTLDPFTTATGLFDGRLPRGHHSSPPCQGFSMAGKGRGREDSQRLIDSILRAAGGEAQDALEGLSDERSRLSVEPLRWIEALTPRWITFEQVPAVLPLWEAYAEVFREWGYSVWTGHLHAEQYGVPQARKRAWLIATRDGEALPPTPTHSRYHPRTPNRLDEGVKKWVSMAEALGWGEGVAVQPSATVTSKVGRNRVIAEAEARVNNQSGTKFDLGWPADRPAPVIAGRGLVTMPGANANRFNGATKSRNDGLRVSVQEAAVLQSFPPGYVFCGKQGERFQQVGDAVPPLVAAAVAGQVIR